MSTGAVWTESNDAILRALWGKHFTRYIGATLGKTRNAIIGRARRLGLDKQRSYYPGKPKVERDRRITRRAVRNLPPELFAAVSAPADPLNLDIVAVGQNQCRWPVGVCEYGRHLFCGHTTPDGASYCGWHHSIAHNPPRDPRDKFIRRRAA